MRVAILQPNYIPWRGYIDFFKQCDVFVYYDDVQYTKNDWRNRNLIKNPDGAQWLTIPIITDNRISNKLIIRDAIMHQNNWQMRHLEAIEANYKHAPYYGDIREILTEAYEQEKQNLSKLCQTIISRINDYLGLRCKTLLSSEMGFNECAPTERLVQICRSLGATEYLSGDAAKEYLQVDKFGDIRVLWHRYHEQIYPQLWGDFISRVSIIDTLMNCGRKTYDII
jgi:hypothetical protein